MVEFILEGKTMSIRIAATGDSFIVRPISPDRPGFSDLAEKIRQADVCFTNLETVIRRGEGFPSAQSGGTWASSPPEVLQTLRALGFNCLAWGNNHTLDYSYGGLEATRKFLDEGKWVHAGAGLDLEEAGAARFLETPKGRVALLSATSSYYQSWPAQNPGPVLPGRPGINPLGHKTVYRIPAEEMEMLRNVAARCGVNARRELRIKEGFVSADPEGVFRFGEPVFELARDGALGEFTRPLEADAKRILQNIEKAAREADCVIFSMHAHEGKNADKHIPADFLVEFCRACIEAGAHAVIGHGPHVLRGMELYRKRPVFYSLGDFIFQNELVEHLPLDFYQAYGIDPALSTREAMLARSEGGTKGLACNPAVWRSVVATMDFDQGDLVRLELCPIDLGQRRPVEERGIPVLTESAEALIEMETLSEPFGTRFRREGATLVYP